MRICILSFAHPIDDDRLFHRQARILREAGHEISILGRGTHRGVGCRKGAIEGIPFLSLPRRVASLWLRLFVEPFDLLAFAFRAARFSRGCEVLHCPEYQSVVVGILLRRLRRQILVYDCHEYQPEGTASWLGLINRRWYRPAYRLATALERWVASRVDAVVTVNQTLADRFAPYISRICVFPNYPPANLVDVAESPISCVQSLADRVRGRMVLLFAGYLSDDRGVAVCIEALAKVQSANLPIHMIVAGHCDDPARYRALAESLGVSDCIDFTGRYGPADIGHLLKMGDIGLYPVQSCFAQYLETDATKLYLYAAGGLAMILTDCPAHQRFIEQVGNCARLVEPPDAERVAAAITDLTLHPERIHKMGTLARQAFENQFNTNVISPRLVELYADLTHLRDA